MSTTQQTPPQDETRDNEQEAPEQSWRGVFEDDPDRELSRATTVRLKEDSRKLLGELLRPHQKMIWLLVVIVVVENAAPGSRSPTWSTSASTRASRRSWRARGRGN